MTSTTVLAIAAFLGMLAVILGAFGAHGLKKIATDVQVASFETGVKYQMYHAIVLLFVGNYFSEPSLWLVLSFLIGIFLFSFSIYGLVFLGVKGKKAKFLGPITPLGGLLLILGWLQLLVAFI